MDQLKVSGWKIAQPPHTYGIQDLFEYINGAADFFIAYGFVSLEGAYYYCETAPDDSVTIDIYDMGEKLNAFGVFQSKRPGDVPFVDIGAAAFGGDGYLAFYKDRYFVEINAFVKSAKCKTQPLIMAQQLAKLLPGDSSAPHALSYFPEQGKVKGSERYVVGGILGHAFLDKGIVCNYKVEEDTVTVFLAFQPSREAAGKSFLKHQQLLRESGNCLSVGGLGERAIISKEPYHKHILIAQTGPYIIGVYDLSIPEKGKPILNRLATQINAPHLPKR